ncbi:SDR family oxidoreductase [Polaromonas sp. YR568]|uniref:SDR family oxidoreductase n=1 Tax=Polaromonas sp. YR568 TaxID=1855301 RepID=UPI0031378B4F
MNLHLQNKHILITGGSKGIGLACAAAFLQEGAHVTLVARNAETLAGARQLLIDGAPEGAKVQTVSADLTSATAAATALTEAEALGGPVDVLVNSAGAAKRTPAADLTPQSWQDAMQSKFFSYINICDPVIKKMAARREGVIINIIGNSGKVANPVHLPGGSANAALILATTGLANAYASQGVRVNAISPGSTLTERLGKAIALDAKNAQISPEVALARITDKLPLGRIAQPEEIAQAVLFLASSQASYVTGANLMMDGAMVPVI